MTIYKQFTTQTDELRNKLVTIMKEKKLTQRAAASQIGIAIGTLGTFLRGARNPEFLSLTRIEEYVLASEKPIHSHKNPHDISLCDICKDRKIREKITM